MITRKEAIEKLKETGMKVPSKMKDSRFKRVVDLIMLLTEKAHEEGYESGENCGYEAGYDCGYCEGRENDYDLEAD